MSVKESKELPRSNILMPPSKEQIRNTTSTKNELGQTMVSAPAQMPPDPILKAPSITQEWQDERHTYLKERGWVLLGTNDRGNSIWADPKGADQSKATLKEAVRLPVKDGGEEIIRQWVWPPTQWNWATEDALMIQKQREWAGETLEQTIARKKQELEDLEKQLRKQRKEEAEE
jgi:hypothetical protein